MEAGKNWPPCVWPKKYSIFYSSNSYFYIFITARGTLGPNKQLHSQTRMYSSRMRTGHSLTVCRSLLPGGGGGWVSAPGGVSAPEGSAPGEGVSAWGCLLLGGVCSWGVSAPGGVCSWGVSALGGCCLLLGVCSWGGCLLPGGCGIPACTEADIPPVDRMTDRCKNITLATTLLRPVNISSFDYRVPTFLIPSNSLIFPRPFLDFLRFSPIFFITTRNKVGAR